MRHLMASLGVLIAGLVLPGSALAQSETRLDAAKLNACIDAQIDGDRPVADCLNPALVTCLDFAVQAPAAAILCFRDAKAEFAGLMSQQLTALQPKLDEATYGAVEINARYDTLTNLVQCDRMNELQVLQAGGGERSELQKARCEVTASGLVYIKLYWQARQIAEAGQ